MTFDKVKTLEIANKYKHFSYDENELMMKTMEQIKDFMLNKIKFESFEAFLLLTPLKIQDAAFDIMGAMYPDKISPMERYILAGKINDKICDKCGGVGNFCTGMKNKKRQYFSICGLCQMEVVSKK